MPTFEIDGGLGLALVRGFSVAACLSVLGALVFRLAVAPPALARLGAAAVALQDQRWLWLLWGCVALALLGGASWLVLESGDMVGATGIGGRLSAVPLVVLHSRFGRILVIRLVLLAAVPMVLGMDLRRHRLAMAAALGGVAAALQSMFGHAASMEGGMNWLALSTTLHVLAAGLWLGQLPPLWLFLADAPAAAASLVLRRFSPLGLACVIALAATASLQGWTLVGGIAGVVGTAYGWSDLTKLSLFAILLVIAALNRFTLMPKLETEAPASVQRILLSSVVVETCVGFLVILTAGILASLPPAMHEQPIWPFPWRLSLAAMAQPDLRREVIEAIAAVTAAIALLSAALILRRLRWVAVLVALALFVLAGPHLELLLVQAYPTSYFTSPTGFTAAGISHGAEMFQANCVACHGAQGRGDGPKAKDLAIPPADLTADHLWEHSDGELFWWLSHGIEGPDGTLAMPGFATTITDRDRWDLIDYIRANNAGEKLRATGAWEHPIAAPDFDVDCGAKGTKRLSQLKGKVVYLVAAADQSMPSLMPAGSNVVTVRLSPRPLATETGICVAAARDAWEAFSILAGVSPRDLDGTRFLIDSVGWLRTRWQPGHTPDWNNPAVLTSLIDEIEHHSVGASVNHGRHHHPS